MAPVVIARATHEARTIAVCIDGSEASLSAARFLSTLPLFHQAERVFVVGVDVVDDRSGGQPLALSDVAEGLGDIPEPRVLVSESRPVEAIVEFIKD